MARLTSLSYGGTAAIVTSMSLVVGLDTAMGSRAALVSSLLVVALADNLSDSLAIHMYQEAERLAPRRALRSTLLNFVVRLLVATTFVVQGWLLPSGLLVPVTLGWGFLLLGVLTALIARERGIAVGPEIGKHLTTAAAVLALSRVIAGWIAARLH